MAKRKIHLIVVPASTLANWQNELRRFCPSLVVATYHGTQHERTDLRYNLRKDIEGNKLDILLSTFSIFERDSGKDDRTFLYKQKFEYLVIDEAHCLKVSTSSRFINLNEIKAGHRLLLSGTPVQNDLRELLALMSFILPEIFQKIGIDDLLDDFGWDKRSSAPSSSSKSVSINQLRTMLAPFILRRIKHDVLNQLVEKSSVLETIIMTDFQSAVYDNIISGHLRRKEKMKILLAAEVASGDLINTLKVRSKKVNCPEEYPPIQLKLDSTTKMEREVENSVSGELNDIVIDHDLSASEAAHLFTALRKAANHPLLLRVRYQDDNIMTEIAQVCYSEGRFGRQCDYQRVRDEIDKFSDFDLHQLCIEYSSQLGRHQLDSETLYDSQKMRKLRDILPKLVVSDNHDYQLFF